VGDPIGADTLDAVEQHGSLRGGEVVAGELGQCGGGALEAGQEAVILDQGPLQFGNVLGTKGCGNQVVAATDGRGGADGLAQDGAGAHHPGGAEGGVGGADVAPGEEQVGYVDRMEHPKGDGVGGGGRQELRFLVDIAAVEKAHRVVVVQRPAAVSDHVVEGPVRLDVVLSQDVRPDIAPAFAFAGQEADPLQLPGFGAMVAVVLEVVPHAVGGLEQLVADLLGIVEYLLVAT